MHSIKLLLFSGTAKPGNDKTMTSKPTPYANDELEKAIPREGQEHAEDSESLLMIRKGNAKRKVVICCVALAILLALLLIPVLFCGVFQEAKDTAEDHAIGIVLRNTTVAPSSTRF